MSKAAPSRTSFLKYIFLTLCVLLFSLLFFWSSIEKIFTKITLDPKLAAKSDLQAPQIASKEILVPRFLSKDKKGRPYSIEAIKGTQKENEQVLLETVKGTLQLSPEEQVTVTAQDALITPGQKGTAHLEGDVTLTHSQGHTLRTDRADVDFQAGIVQTTSPVQGEGPKGAVSAAQGMTLNQTTETLLLHGPSKITIFQTEKSP